MSNQNPIQQIKNELAVILGEDPENIQQIAPRWLNFMRAGVIVKVHVGRWRGRSKLTYSDLGLPEPSGDAASTALKGLLTLGRKSLLPQHYLARFDAIEASARKVVADSGAETAWGTFISAERYREKVKIDLQRFQREYFAVLTNMVERWEQVKFELADEYRHQARLAYDRLSKIAPDLVSIGETSFVEGFVSSILALVPPLEQIQESYKFDWVLSFIPLPDLLSEEGNRATVFDADTQREYQTVRHEQKMNSIIENAEQERQRRAMLAEQQIRQEILDKARQEKETQVTTFMRDLVAQLRTLVYEASTDILGTMQKNEKLHPRSIVQIRNLIDTVGQMNFFGDGEIDQMIDRVRREMDAVRISETKSTASMQNALEAVATLTRETLINLGEAPRSGREVGIVYVPTQADTRRARMVLDIPEPEQLGTRRHGRGEVTE